MNYWSPLYEDVLLKGTLLVRVTGRHDHQPRTQRGHVRHHHGLRLAIQAAGLAALIATLAGDAVSITGLAVALPTALLQSGYSREFEDEADAYAFRRLKEIKLSPKYFAQILARIEESRNKDPDANRGSAQERRRSDLGYLSTHPATAERIERALKNQ